MDIKLYQKYVICVYESGSLTQAAKRLGISQPALSNSMNAIEKKLGFRIFDRKATPVKLTSVGEIYLEYLRKEQLLTEDYQKKIADMNQRKNTSLTVGGPVVYVDALITKATTAFRSRYPECEIRIKNEPVPELIRQAKNGEVDCFISTSDILPERFTKTVLKKEKIYLGIPRDWKINEALTKDALGEITDYSLLNGQEFIFLEEDQPLQKEMEKFFEQKGIIPKHHIRVNQLSTAWKLARTGAGIAFVSEEALQIDQWEKELCMYVLPEGVSGRNIYIAWDSERYITYACRELIQQLQDICLKETEK